MTIEISEFVDVSIAVSPVGVAGGNFGILGFLTNEEGVITSAERSRAYTSLTSVAADWATTTEVYKAATAFYAQTPTPKDFVVQVCFETDQVATLTGGGSDTVLELNAIAGTSVLDITVDGTPAALTTLDFSGDADFDDIAATLETALALIVASATVTHNGYQFVINGVTAGVVGTITFGSGSTSDALGLSAHQAKISQGLDNETPVTALSVALASGLETVGLVTHKKYRDVLAGSAGETTAEIASWAEAANRIFCNTTNDLTVLVAGTTTDIASVLKGLTLRKTLTTFAKNPAEYPSASVFGRAASVNFAAIGSTITLNLKQMPTITAEDLTPAEFQSLKGKNASAVVKIGNSVNAYVDSRMASGTWLDTVHGILWLENRCGTDLFNLLYQTNTKIPYTQTGINSAIATLDRSLEAAVRNGLAGPGFLPNGKFLPKGYLVTSVSLEDTPAGDKSNRFYGGLSFEMVGAGALHELSIAGQFTE